jgi:hypothetical protein
MTTFRRMSLLGATLVLAASCNEAGETLPSPRLLTTSEYWLKAAAQKTERPTCRLNPQHLSPARLAVVNVHIARSGRVFDVDVIEAPSDHASALVAAVKRWQFEPMPLIDGAPEILSGLLTFYFITKNGQCVVAFPDEIGYVGKWAAAPGPA